MVSRRYLTWFGLVALAIVLSVGFLEVLGKRFAEGGVYPHYASFRSDPLGTSGFYEALSSLDGIEVVRNIQPLESIDGLHEDSVILLLGLPRESWGDLRATNDSSMFKAVKEGARLVVTINPGLVPEKFQPARTSEEEDWFERRRRLREERIRAEQGERSKIEPQDQEVDDEEKLELEMDDALGARLTILLEVELESLEEFERPEEGWELSAGTDKSLRELPSWYSQFRFKPASESWRIIAEAEDGPVVIERQFGEGSIVLASDSFFVSNEALHLEPVASFLSWLLGDKTQVIFDETIHGSRESGGAMKLIRRYRIHGVFFGMTLFIALWAWRTSSPLAPGDDTTDDGFVGGGEAIAGEETASGLVRMLRKSIEPSKLLPQCVEIWKESQRRTPPEALEKEIAHLLQRHERDKKTNDAVSTYHRLTDCLRRH
ncbi:MAG: DUF4350 domain-containing protein [Verrucomicrobiales bacterium]|nr:DUF4350 domain-containing protein [Verrucomicrobiales bacterium]